MAKKKIIFPDQAPEAYVIGIASNERIWTLAWAINSALGISLGRESDRSVAESPLEIYVDHAGQDFDYCLMEVPASGIKVSKLAKNFRFWLFARPRRDVDFPMDAHLTAINGVETVSMAIDLSDEKDIQPLLP